MNDLKSNLFFLVRFSVDTSKYNNLIPVIRNTLPLKVYSEINDCVKVFLPIFNFKPQKMVAVTYICI